MNEEKYFIIKMNEDGEIDFYVFNNSEEIIAEFELNILEDINKEDRPKFFEDFEEIPIDLNYWNGKILIIKGKRITPKAKKIITKYEIE